MEVHSDASGQIPRIDEASLHSTQLTLAPDPKEIRNTFSQTVDPLSLHAIEGDPKSLVSCASGRTLLSAFIHPTRSLIHDSRRAVLIKPSEEHPPISTHVVDPSSGRNLAISQSQRTLTYPRDLPLHAPSAWPDEHGSSSSIALAATHSSADGSATGPDGGYLSPVRTVRSIDAVIAQHGNKLLHSGSSTHVSLTKQASASSAHSDVEQDQTPKYVARASGRALPVGAPLQPHTLSFPLMPAAPAAAQTRLTDPLTHSPAHAPASAHVHEQLLPTAEPTPPPSPPRPLAVLPSIATLASQVASAATLSGASAVASSHQLPRTLHSNTNTTNTISLASPSLLTHNSPRAAALSGVLSLIARDATSTEPLALANAAASPTRRGPQPPPASQPQLLVEPTDGEEQEEEEVAAGGASGMLLLSDASADVDVTVAVAEAEMKTKTAARTSPHADAGGRVPTAVASPASPSTHASTDDAAGGVAGGTTSTTSAAALCDGAGDVTATRGHGATRLHAQPLPLPSAVGQLLSVGVQRMPRLYARAHAHAQDTRSAANAHAPPVAPYVHMRAARGAAVKEVSAVGEHMYDHIGRGVPPPLAEGTHAFAGPAQQRWIRSMVGNAGALPPRLARARAEALASMAAPVERLLQRSDARDTAGAHEHPTASAAQREREHNRVPVTQVDLQAELALERALAREASAAGVVSDAEKGALSSGSLAAYWARLSPGEDESRVQSPLGPGAPVPLADSEVDSRAGSAPSSTSPPPPVTPADTNSAAAVAGGTGGAVVQSALRALPTRPQPLVAGVAAPHAPTVHHRVPRAQPSTHYPPLLLALADAPLDQTLASARRRHARGDASVAFPTSASPAADSSSDPPFRRHWRHAALLAAVAERMLSPAPGGLGNVAAEGVGVHQREQRRDISLSRAAQLAVHTGPLALAQALTRLATRAPESVLPLADPAEEVSVMSPSLRVGMVLAALHLVLLGTTAHADARADTPAAEEEAAAALLRVVHDAVCSDEREVVATLEHPMLVDAGAAQRAVAKVARVGVERALAAEARERAAAVTAEMSARTHAAFNALGTDPADTLALELCAGAEATQLVEALRSPEPHDSSATPPTSKSLDIALLAPVGAPLTLSVPFSVLCARLEADNTRLVAAIARLRLEVGAAQARATAAHEECHSAVSLLEKHQLQLALLDRGAHTTAQELLALVHGLRESREELALLEDSSAHLLHLCAPAGLTLGGEKERQWLWQLAQERLGDARMCVDVEKGEVWGVGEEEALRTSMQGSTADNPSPVAHVTKALVLERHLRWLAGVERALQAAEREARARWEQTVLLRARFSAAADATVGLCAAEDNATSERALARWVAGAVANTPARTDGHATDSPADTAPAWQTAALTRDNPFLAALAALPSLADVALASAARGLPSDDVLTPPPERAATPRPLRSRRRGARGAPTGTGPSSTTSLLDVALLGGPVPAASTMSTLRCPRCGSTSAEPEHMTVLPPALESLPAPLATPSRVLSPAQRRSPRKRLGAQAVASPPPPSAPAAAGPPPCPCAVERAWAACDEDELYLHAVRAYGRSGRGKTSRRAKRARATSASVPTPPPASAATDASTTSALPNTIVITPPTTATATAVAASAPCSPQEVVLRRIFSPAASSTHPIRAFMPFTYHAHERTPLTDSAAVPSVLPASSLSEAVWAPALPFLPLPSLLHLNAHLPRLPPAPPALLSHVLTFFSVLTSTFRQAHLARVSLPLPSHVYARHLLATHAQAPLGLVPAAAASVAPGKAASSATADSASPESSLLALLARGDAAVADVAQAMRATVSVPHRQGPSRNAAPVEEVALAAHAATAIQLALPASSPLAAAARALAAQAADSVGTADSAAPSRAAAASLPHPTAVSALLLAHTPMLVSATNALCAAAQNAHLPLYHLFLATLVGAAAPTAYAESEACWRFEQQRIAHYVHVRLVAATTLALARELSGHDRPAAVAAASACADALPLVARVGTRSVYTYARAGPEADTTDALNTRFEGQNGSSTIPPLATTLLSPLSSTNTAPTSAMTATIATTAVTDAEEQSQPPTERAALPMLHVDASTPMSARNSPVKAAALTRTRRRADGPPLTGRAHYGDLQDDANGRASFSGGASARGAAMAVLASFASPRAQAHGAIAPPPSARAMLSPRARTLAAHAAMDGSMQSLSELGAYKSAAAKLSSASSRGDRADRPLASSVAPGASATARHISSLFTRPIRHALLSRLAAAPASPHGALTQPPGPTACGLWLARGQVFASERAFLAMLADLYPHKSAAQRMQLFAAAAQHPVAAPAADGSAALYQSHTQPAAISLSSLLAPAHRHAIAPANGDTLPRASFAALLTHQHATDASTLLLCSLRCALYRLATLPERALAHLDADWRDIRDAARATASANMETSAHVPSSSSTGSTASFAAAVSAAPVSGWALAPYGTAARRGSQPGAPAPRTCACCYATEVLNVDGYPASSSVPSSPTSSTTSLALALSSRRATPSALTLAITRARRPVPSASPADRRVWAPALPALTIPCNAADSTGALGALAAPLLSRNVWVRTTAQQASVHRTGVCPCLLLERYTHALLAHVSHGAPKPTHPLVHLYGHAEGPHVSLRHLRLALHLVVPQLHLIDVTRLCSVAFAGAEVDVHAAARLELVLQRLSLAGLLSVPHPHPVAGSDATRSAHMAALADAVASSRDATFAPSASPTAAGAAMGVEERRGRITRLRKQTDAKVDVPVYLCGDCAYSTTLPTIPPCNVCRHIVCEHMSLEKLLGASGAGSALTHAFGKLGASACGALCCSSRDEPHLHAYLQLYHPLMAHVGEHVLSTDA